MLRAAERADSRGVAEEVRPGETGGEAGGEGAVVGVARAGVSTTSTAKVGALPLSPPLRQMMPRSPSVTMTLGARPARWSSPSSGSAASLYWSEKRSEATT